MKNFNNIQPPFKPYYRVDGLEVSYNGKAVRQQLKKYGSGSYHYLKINTDEKGNKYIWIPPIGNIMVDLMVATCYCPYPKNKSRGDCMVIHRDGDKSNCHRYNLKWVTRDEYRKMYWDELSYTEP